MEFQDTGICLKLQLQFIIILKKANSFLKTVLIYYILMKNPNVALHHLVWGCILVLPPFCPWFTSGILTSLSAYDFRL